MVDMLQLAVREGDIFSRDCPDDEDEPIGEVILGSPFMYVEDQPQARLSDPVSPEGEILMGSPFTYVDDLPAARWGDYFTCKDEQITAAIFTYIA